MGVGLGTSMWSGVSGLLANSTKMGTIGNNLANVNTYGFKGARTDFMDLMSANVGTAAGVKQIGRGVRVGTVVSDYSQGGLETTSENLDMAISGNGFFMVKQKSQVGSNGKMLNTGNSTTYYTRAGDFSFDSDGYLVTPQGLAVQGWKVDQDRIDAASAAGTVLSQVPVTGEIQDIRLTQFTSPAKATSSVTMVTQLDSDTTSQNIRDVGTDYYSAMTQQWNGTKNPSMPSTAYGYQSTIKVYDENGSPHTLTTYYDKITSKDGKDYWEYAVTCNPSEDGRVDSTGLPFANTETAGLLMTGTMTFDSSGSLENMSAYTMLSNATPGGSFDNTVWSAAKVENGYPIFTANFKSVSNASFTGQTNALNIALNVGISNKNGFVAGTGGSTLAAADNTGLPDYLVSFDPATTKVNSTVTTSYATSSSTVFSSQNGYTSGLLTSVSVDSDGILTGTFSNGQTQKLWALALANFTNLQGLSRQGSNLYAATLDSGQGTTNRANTGSVGSISGNTLETSNVDMASEMVSMILTQRGFEANSKTITTVDSMLSEVIQLKR
ncbi:MAG: flagellar hook-basal body protein [Solidesulfovibrio magneticus str. Maddingley MBC34]|uniref:Flagellar hook protein FlgE n=1 Tax=Solidesulfovibrio magneticus str. Maddingley MBC34 TaxID=1206767 RepID=K6GEH4_9BACT|nr:MAG: flagellar hook-basal body protein [Solidesulfovibrio magneticus str. Maddingley MBC34]